MDFLTLQGKLKTKQCPRWNDQQRKWHAYNAVQTYTFYELLSDSFADFDDRYKDMGAQKDEYRPLNERRSAVEYRLPGIIARDVVAMLFGEGKFPTILFENQSDTDAAREIIREANLEEVLNTAATIAAVGAVALIPEAFVDGDHRRLFVDIWNAWECEPVFRRMQPGTLQQITRTWPVKREELIADGYDIEALEEKWRKRLEGEFVTGEKKKYDDWYCRRRITETESLWFEPVPKQVYEKKDWDEWEEDRDGTDADGNETLGRSVAHNLGICPALWAAPLARPGAVSGPCIFDGAINNELIVERIASVGAQAVVTAGQPILTTSSGGHGPTGLLEEANLDKTDGYPTSNGGQRVGPEDILEVNEANGAWLVQLDAGALSPMDALILRVRALSLENCGGSRITEESLAGAKSGYAMELLNQALTYVAGAMRPSWSRSLLSLLLIIAVMQEKFGDIDGIDKKLSSTARWKTISWGKYYEPSGQDLQAEVAATVAARDAGLIDSETAIANTATYFDVVDVSGMKSKIDGEKTQRAAEDHQRQLELKTASPAPAA